MVGHWEKDAMNWINSNLVLTAKVDPQLESLKGSSIMLLNLSLRIYSLLAKDLEKMLAWRYAIYFKDHVCTHDMPPISLAWPYPMCGLFVISAHPLTLFVVLRFWVIIRCFICGLHFDFIFWEMTELIFTQ